MTSQRDTLDRQDVADIGTTCVDVKKLCNLPRGAGHAILRLGVSCESHNKLNKLVFLMETHCVSCEVGTECLNVTSLELEANARPAHYGRQVSASGH
jgi:hypothetical protein